MLTLAVALSLLIGLALGLLGGGGSILTVPIFIYVLSMEAKSAIATSLLVVGITSTIALLQHAFAGNVRWRVGLLFGVFGMMGAFAGGLLAKQLPSWLILTLFATLMLGTAAAMLRGRRETREGTPQALWKVGAEGLIVGVVTGLVGAGGGFLVVPALAILGGLPMRQAIGTSLLVIAMKSFAGFAGYLSHVEVDYVLSAWITGAAVIGSLAGAQLGAMLPQETLRRGFAYFVLVMAAFLLYQQLPAGWINSIHGRWPAVVGGFAIGGFALLFLYFQNQMLGVSSGYLDVCQSIVGKQKLSWRVPFIIGIVLGGFVAAFVSGGFSLTTSAGLYDLVASSLVIKALLFTLGGVLLGYGARVAGGCTSGHSIVGIAQMAPSSLIATAGFMLTGFAVTNLLLRAFGGVA
jgi:uncharacterized membrane protein YfcA/uncharacterized membrane protein YedE/YeeE